MKEVLRGGYSTFFIFTLLTISTITLSVVLPYYRHFVALSKRTEAFINLDLLYKAQCAFFDEFGHYSSCLQGPDSIDWKPIESSFYTYGFSGDSDTHYIKSEESVEVGNILTEITYADKSGFIAAACAHIDGALDVITIDQSNNIKIYTDGILE